MYVVVAVVGVIALAFVYNFRIQVETYKQKHALENTFDEYAHAVASRDYRTAYQYGGDAFQAAISEQAFTAQQVAFEAKLGTIKSDTMSLVYMHGSGSPMLWTALAEEMRRYEKGRLEFECEFRLENGRWHLFGCKQED